MWSCKGICSSLWPFIGQTGVFAFKREKKKEKGERKGGKKKKERGRRH